MVEIEIDGVKVEVPEGSMLMDATQRIGTYVPHFCYHKKLSIAANCRMCLVEVEKAPKPLPACATPVTAGMVVRTASPKAIAAQKSVMEFLLINHPLDCPICDQGGECQLQDLAVGYGGSTSRYQEEKRVVFHKDMGPLVSAQEMSRCIHCTRCVRFGQEVAGVMELGMAGRGEHSEILSFVGRSVESELSGNMIDLCPVGALTSKPFRYSARTWELARRRSVSPHDSLGSNLVVQVKGDRVMRVLPYEVDEINECWISDKDRFAYEGLYADDRITSPMVRKGDQWVQTDWESALNLVAEGIKTVLKDTGVDAFGVLASPASTLEELSLAARMVRGLGGDNIDVRLRQTDFSADGQRAGIPWLGFPIAKVKSFDRLLVVGSFLRKDHPLMAQRIRQAAKRKLKVISLHSMQDDWLMPVAASRVVAPSEWARELAEITVAVAAEKGVAAPAALAGVKASDAALAVAKLLVAGKAPGIVMGNAVGQHPEAARIEALVQALAGLLEAPFGHLTEAGNTVGAHLAGAVPKAGGRNAAQMLAGGLKAVVLLNTEPDLDSADGAQALEALKATPFVVALSTHSSRVKHYAHVILPIAPFTETSGSYVNCEGRVQSFAAAVRPLGQTRPGWKVLRVLANLLGIAGFDESSSESVRKAIDLNDVASRLNNTVNLQAQAPAGSKPSLTRVANVPIYSTDAIVRRAASLQATPAAAPALVRMHPETAKAAGVAGAGQVFVKMNGHPGCALGLQLDATQAPGVVQIPAGVPETVAVGPMFGDIEVRAV